MQYIERAPPSALRDIVRCFWALRVPPSGATVQTIVPDGCTEIVLHLGEPFCEVGHDGGVTRQARALAAGQLTRPFMIQPADGGDALGIRFATTGAETVFGGALPELRNRVTPLGDVVLHLERRLFDAVRRARTLDERLDALAAALARSLARPPDPKLAQAVGAIARSGGSGARIRVVARNQGMSVRTLERRVRAGTGLSPRTLAQVLRFGRAFGMLNRTPVGSWTRVAHDAGYFDQAHMIREFRRFAGAAPSHFFQHDPVLARAFAGDDA